MCMPSLHCHFLNSLHNCKCWTLPRISLVVWLFGYWNTFLCHCWNSIYYGQPMFIFDHTCCYGNAHSHFEVCIEVTFLRSGPTCTQEDWDVLDLFKPLGWTWAANEVELVRLSKGGALGVVCLAHIKKWVSPVSPTITLRCLLGFMLGLRITGTQKHKGSMLEAGTTIRHYSQSVVLWVLANSLLWHS